MSKEIAQTVGGKRIAWLIAIMAAFAVLATLGSQWQKSEAALPSSSVTLSGGGAAVAGGPVSYTATFAFNPSGSVAAGGSGTFVVNFDDDLIFSSVTGTGIAAIDTADCTNSGATNVVTCTDDAGEFWTDGTLIFNFVAPLAGGTITAPTAAQCTLTDVTSVQCSVTATGATVANPVQVSPETATNLLGDTETFTFTFEPGWTCESDTDTTLDSPECLPSDVIISAGLSLAGGPTVSGNTVTVDVINSSGTSTGGTVCLSVMEELEPVVPLLQAQVAAISSECGTKIYTAAELRSMSDVVGYVLTGQEFNWNVRGSRHTVCTVAANTGIDLNGDGDYTDTNESAPVAIQLPGLTLANINIQNGGGYASTADTDPDVVDLRVFIGDGTATGLPTSSVNAGLAGATCFSWVSTDAGDQQINLLYVGDDGASYAVNWDTDNDNNDADGVASDGPTNRALVKEWNRLEDSVVTLSGGASGSVTGTGATGTISRTVNVTLNPATGLYQFTAVNIADIFRGSHTNTAGQKEGPSALAGVAWTATLTGCGNINGGTAAITGVTTIGAGGTIQNSPNIVFTAGGAGVNCGPGQTAVITFTGTEPGPLGSGTGITVTEVVTLTFAQNIAEKKVFLAWAGQRIVLEHDWRLLPGDNAPFTANVGPTPNGSCAFTDPFVVQYIKGGGPGNFLPGLNAGISGSDEAFVFVGDSDNSQTLQISNVDNDIIGDPQGNCISRVLFESEQPGQVDIEAFAYSDDFFISRGQNIEGQFPSAPVNATKVAFVVYYMKINTINISLASQFEKPSHNNSTSLPDWTTGKTAAPANPWNASLDDADNAVDWNVSKDILVRGRVTGWFLNENPSGRAADTSNPLNVLPANRWVMPNDWPLLAGGPADPADGTDAIGTAEQFRPYYDIMFAPNNARGITLSTPEGATATQLTFVATGNTGTGSGASTAIRVVSCADLTAGLGTIAVGSTSVGSVVSCSGTSLVVSSPLASAPAAGTGVFLLTTVPFEGPYSTIDIVGLAAQGFGGAALSNFVVGNIRDTALDDGDVDWFDAPMPETHVSVNIRGTGFLKEVLKDEVYYIGTPNNAAAQLYTNPYYITNIPGSPFIPAVVAGGGYLWNSWGLDGPGGNGQGVYRFWQAALIGTNSEGIGEALSTADQLELGLIRTYTGDPSAARDLVVYTDNHGEFMVAANGDFKTDLTACATNVLAGGKHCKPGDKVGTGTISATVDYPDFRGKHFPVLSNAATVNWTWGGYKDVTVEFDPNVDQYAYIVFHAMDRDGFCSPLGTGANLLHSVLGRASAYSGISDDLDTEFTIANLGGSAAATAGGRYNNDPVENVDFLIDSGEGIIVGTSGGTINDGRQFATGVTTFSVAENDPATTGIREFPLSPLAGTGQTDECQAWIQVSNSLLGVLNVLAVAKDDEGNIGFDRIIDLTNTTSYTLNFRWSLITWAGADNISVNDALKGTGTGGANPGGNDISASVTAIYGWDAAAQQWLGYFPSGVNVPGANDLTTLRTGQAYWIAITGPSSVTWTIASNVN